ncbi:MULTISPECIES: hypothetical protein [unclassified Streptomyces]|uniref:hypothetical protein n=1 Tax=unclassified Streptomyces TaxID=2593676 RepID=UPI0036E16A3B
MSSGDDAGRGVGSFSGGGRGTEVVHAAHWHGRRLGPSGMTGRAEPFHVFRGSHP